MAKGFFIVRTPFQLFNAIEAQKRFEICTESYLLCIYKKEIDRILMEKIASRGQWKEIKWFQLTSFNRAFFPLLLNRFLKRMRDAEYCFFGLITPLITHCINTANAKQPILLDDGNEVLLIAQKILSFTSTENSLLNQIRGRHIDYRYLQKIKIFTFFDLSRLQLNNQIILNDYRMFKQETSTLPTAEEIFFIGSNLIGTYISPHSFENELEKVIRYFMPLTVTYILHRYEDEHYFKALSAKLNFKTVKFDTILEVALLEYAKKPLTIATFRSTALETLGYLYDPIQQIVFTIHPNILLKEPQKEEFSNLYLHYQRKKIQLITI